MRPKFVFALISLAALILGASLFLKQHLQNASAPPTRAEIKTPALVTDSSNVTSVAPVPTFISPTPAFISPAPAATNILTPEQHQTAIDAETDRLQEWSVNDDPASLSNILVDLTNPDKEIRVAAIEAAKQFGSADAIPALKAAAEATDDLQEKIDYLQAADFLSLPGISDSSVQLPLTPEQIQANAQRDAERVALDQDEVKHHVQDNNPPAPPPTQTGPGN
jgi:hypothetical protein